MRILGINHSIFQLVIFFRWTSPKNKPNNVNRSEKSQAELGTNKALFFIAKKPNWRKPSPNGPKTGTQTQNHNKPQKADKQAQNCFWMRKLRNLPSPRFSPLPPPLFLCFLPLPPLLPRFPPLPPASPRFPPLPPRSPRSPRFPSLLFYFFIKIPRSVGFLRIAPRICKVAQSLHACWSDNFVHQALVDRKFLKTKHLDMVLTFRRLHNNFLTVFIEKSLPMCFHPHHHHQTFCARRIQPCSANLGSNSPCCPFKNAFGQ